MKIISEKGNILGLKFLVQRDKSMENTEERRKYYHGKVQPPSSCNLRGV